MKIVTPDEHSHLLDSVQTLWRAHSGTLGFFPVGAFAEHARKRWIICAVDREERLLGYTIFRLSKARATIVQLCVAPSSRRRGLARTLLDALRAAIPQGCRGIRLSCRNDFDATASWPRLGFCAIAEIPGRGQQQLPLTVWWQDLREPDLFTKEVDESSGLAIDAQLFFDLVDAAEPLHEQTRHQVDSWMQEGISVYVTDEILNEIQRAPSHLRGRHRKLAFQFDRLTDDPIVFDKVHAELLKILGNGSSPSAESDRRQIAHAIAGGVPYFCTRDEEILGWRELLKEFPISIAHPSEVLTLLDETVSSSKYAPARLRGTQLQTNNLPVNGVEQLSRLLAATTGASYRTVRADVRELLGHSGTIKTISYSDSMLAGVGLEHDRARRVSRVVFLGANKAANRSTLETSLLQAAIKESTDARSNVLTMGVGPTFSAAEQQLGFVHLGAQSIKLLLTGLFTRSELRTELERVAYKLPEIGPHVDAVIGLSRQDTSESAARLQELIWPAHLMDEQIQTFVVPVKPKWAMHLFDIPMSEADFFGGRDDLLLRSENVYYRKVRNSNGLTAPARVLWYVSKPYGQIRSVAIVREVAVESAKVLYKRFQRLGIFAWRDVFALGNGDPEQKVMALRFGPVQQLSNHIPFSAAQKVLLGTHQNANQFASPTRVSDAFARMVLEKSSHGE